MKIPLPLLGYLLAATTLSAAQPSDYSYEPVLFNSVHLEDAFWSPRMETATKVTNPYPLLKMKHPNKTSAWLVSHSTNPRGKFP